MERGGGGGGQEGGGGGGWGRCLRGGVVRGGWLNRSGGGGGRGVGDSCVLIPGRVLRAGERERERNIELTLQLFECLRILICLLLTGRRRESYNYVTLVVIVQDNH